MLIQQVLKGTTVLIVAPVILSACEKAQFVPEEPTAKGPDLKNNLIIDLSLSDNAVLNSSGGSKVVNGIIIINTGNGGFSALASACTHEGAQVEYDSDSGNIQCNNHGSIFSISGSVLKGPAVAPLKSYTITKTGNTLTIKG